MSDNVETALLNFAGGELSPKMRGRSDLPVYYTGCQKMKNFIAETQGPARFRTGSKLVHQTRGNQIAHLIPFQFNDSQAYLLEFTQKKIRFYKDNALILTGVTKNITALSTGMGTIYITSASHGLSWGQEVYVTGTVGTTGVNDRYYYVIAGDADHVWLETSVGASTEIPPGASWIGYSSGGTMEAVYEIDSPYDEDDDFHLIDFTQNADVMYLTHPYYEPRKLTRTGHAAWTLALFTRTADPFVTKKVITAITAANPAKVTCVGHGYSTGDVVHLEEIVGMTDTWAVFPFEKLTLNGCYFTITKVDNDNFTIGRSTVGYSAYASAGYASKRNTLPALVCFYESRLFYATTEVDTAALKASRAPDSNGVNRYDDFTAGTDADHAIAYTIAASSGEVNTVFWLLGTSKFLAAGTFGGTIKITGATEVDPITPTSISVKQVDTTGCANIRPISRENLILYVTRDLRTLRSLEYSVLDEGFVSVDRNLVSEHITSGGLLGLVYQTGRPELVWMYRTDGKLLGLTLKTREDVSGWHTHDTQRGNSTRSDLHEPTGEIIKIISLGAMPRPTNFDQLWQVVEQALPAADQPPGVYAYYRYVEVYEDDEEFLDPIEFYTTEGNVATDRANYLRALAYQQKYIGRLDGQILFDGRALGVSSTATLFVHLLGTNAIGQSVRIVSFGWLDYIDVFSATDVGRQVWYDTADGVHYGRATITAYVSAHEVTAIITEAFLSSDVEAATVEIPAGDWFLTVTTVSNLFAYYGQTVNILADGVEVAAQAVPASGILTISSAASVVILGFKYTGLLQTMNLDPRINLAAQNKKKNISHVGVKFYNSYGMYAGTEIHDAQLVKTAELSDLSTRPPRLFTGEKKIMLTDKWEREKHIVIHQRASAPCVVQGIVPYFDVSF
jgi:hypothetical protein